MNPAASHSNYKIAQANLQPYLDDIYNWTKNNNLLLNPDKFTSTLFTPHTHEHNIMLNLTINNITIPTVKNPKILGLNFDPSLTFNHHTTITKQKAEKSVKS